MIRDWEHPDQAWWVKLGRARKHTEELRQAYVEFKETKPWRVEAEPGRRPNELAYRFRTEGPIPADLAAVAGEVVHSLRSALDAAVHDLATRYLGGPLSPGQKTAFGSYRDEAAFRKSLGKRLSDLCGDRELQALLSVQPFSLAQEAAGHGVEVERDPDTDLAMDVPHRLNELWNIDKHRRLLDLRWHVDELVYWGACGEGAGWQWATQPQHPLQDGTLIGYFRTGDGCAVGSVEPHFEFWLGLTDDPCPWPDDVCKLLAGWHDSLGGWVIARMFLTAETDGPPPILISFP